MEKRHSMKKIREIIEKILGNREVIRYLVIGALTTLINYIAYWAVTRLLGLDALTSNWIAWVVSVVFAYITNKLYVFESHVSGVKALALEMFNFVLARVFSLFVDQAIIWLLVEKLGLYDLICKLFSNFVVIVMNYIFSKLIIFRKR